MDNIVKFAKPYSFEAPSTPRLTSPAWNKLTIQDMIDIQKNLANELASLAALEATTSFAQEMATKASGKPVELFQSSHCAKVKQVQDGDPAEPERQDQERPRQAYRQVRRALHLQR